MPLAAFALLGTFIVAAAVIAAAVTWFIGPRRPRAAILPIVAAVVVLGSFGHQLKAGFGPTVNLYGYDVRLAFDLGLALVVSVAVALVQRAVLQRRSARRT